MIRKLALSLFASAPLWQQRVAGLRQKLRQNQTSASTGHEDGPFCCCKATKCEESATDDSGNYPAVYTPNENLCCKLKKQSCSRVFTVTGYTIEAPASSYCISGGPAERRFKEEASEEDMLLDKAPSGKPASTVQSYCDLSDHESNHEKEGIVESEEREKKNGAIINALFSELSKNSLDTMAKEIFSMYVCVRWAPSQIFINIANSEIRTGQLSNTSSAFKHYEKLSYIPMRCSRTYNVYGSNHSLGDTHFGQFEKKIDKITQWYEGETNGALQNRLAKLNRRSGLALQADAKLFDMKRVAVAVEKCQGNTKPVGIDTFNAPADAFLADCGAARWWFAKLQDWHRAMPFTSFMTPNEVVAKRTAPGSREHMLLCFGKRVASQLHRREDGSHLLTDQSAVGCHGFWDFGTGAKMLKRIVKLWRPPTCQLATMELDMKIKIAGLIANMNTKLFDALPALLFDEVTGTNSDGKPLEASAGVGVAKSVLKSIASSVSSLKGNYVRLGEMLGNTVVKWAVCPLKAESDPARIEELDAALGTDDAFLKHYAKTAYSKWTGNKDLLPGEECSAGTAELPRTQHCSIGHMQESMPEPYGQEEFICPILPLLPAKQQVTVFKQKPNQCFMRMNDVQMQERNWIYRGRTPQHKQYDMAENLPSDKFRCHKIVSMSSWPDKEFHIWRTFVTSARGCTEEEALKTPRWCKLPEVANKKSLLKDLIAGVDLVGGAVSDAVQVGLEGTGLKNRTQANRAGTKQLQQWFRQRLKGFEKKMRKTTDGWIGKASRRYESLYKASFEKVEVADFLHSASFQIEMAQDGSDSKKRHKFDRFAVTCPCDGFEPTELFNLKYEWGENALALARKAHAKFHSGNLLSDSGAFSVQIRGAAMLQIKNVGTAWLTYHTHVRATPVGAKFPRWIETKNPFMGAMTGALNGPADSKLSADNLKGFEARFMCGTRQKMHDLPVDFKAQEGSFLSCVTDGAKRNVELRSANPSAEFLADEVVVRVTFTALNFCYLKVLHVVDEIDNPVHKNFKALGPCKDEIPHWSLPSEFAEAASEQTYRGMLLGKGLPEDTLVEVLLDPAEFVDELQL